jgi:two-component system OmpR family response regulator
MEESSQMSIPATPSDQASSHGNVSVLIVEDERSIARFMEIELIEAGYQVTIVSDGIDALMQASQSPPDLVILDLMIPGIDGLEVCRRLRSAWSSLHDLPILMVTAKNSVPDRVRGLKTGADDYLTKPFSIEELLARIEALLRRCGRRQTKTEDATILQVADLVVNTATRQVMRNHAVIELTVKEYDLLEYLVRHPRQVLHRQQIYEAVWGYDFEGESNVLDVYIRYLRNKLECQGSKLIQTIRGVGYLLKEEVS